MAKQSKTKSQPKQSTAAKNMAWLLWLHGAGPKPTRTK